MLITLLLQATGGTDYVQLAFMLAAAGLFYFFILRPQQKRTSDAKTFRQSLTKGARIVTIGGLHGLVIEVTEDTVVVEVDRGTKLRFDRSAIAREVNSKSTGTALEASTAA